MRLKTTTNVTLDGVMQGLGGAEEDPRNGFERGGWAIPLVDAEGMQYLDDVYAGADAFLFGRRTFEIFAGSWRAFEDPDTPAVLLERPFQTRCYATSCRVPDAGRGD